MNTFCQICSKVSIYFIAIVINTFLKITFPSGLFMYLSVGDWILYNIY